MTAGRSCPLHYRYRPEDIAATAPIRAETFYIIGGLYGNRPALDAILALAEAEPGPVTLIFNGDFNWFDIDPAEFETINTAVLAHHVLRGNVETELAPSAGSEAGCGCSYPDWVDDGTVERSNRIMIRLRETARLFPDLTARLLTLPRYLTLATGRHRIAVVHGDAESLAGWGFAQEALTSDTVEHDRLQQWFDRAGVDVFASSHTCLPVLAELEGGVIVNNGAAGMPNFAASDYGVITRLSGRPAAESLYGICRDGLYIEALAVRYDQSQWRQKFIADWPSDSPAYRSYYRRIVEGPDYSLDQVLRTLKHSRSQWVDTV